MNYGYAPTPFDTELQKRLSQLCKSLPLDEFGKRPHIERDGLYAGVRIRQITHYPEHTIRRIVDQADKIYHQLEREASCIQ